MKKIKNPFVKHDGYCCFGCSPNNALGLRMEFFEEEEGVVSFWNPENHMQGYLNVLHGGIQTLLMDEVAGWTVNVKVKTAGVTTRIDSKFIKPVYVNTGLITIKGKVICVEKKFANIYTSIYNAEHILCSEAEVQYYIYPEDIARKKLWYPGYENFFES